MGRRVVSEHISARVHALLEETAFLESEEVTPQTLLRDDLNMDSLDLVEFAMACEAEFGVEVTDEDVDKLYTVKDAINLIAKKMPSAT